MSDEISILVFIGMFTFIFAMRTVEDTWFVFYTIVASVCFGMAVKLILTN